MDAFEALLTRRSQRQYTDQIIEDAKLDALLTAAMQAPSAGNEQPWHFVLIRKRSELDSLSQVHPYAAMLSQAAAAIVVCADLDIVKHAGFWIQDCSAATQNILIAARALELGAVWLGMYPRSERCKAVQECLGMPKNAVVFSVVALGYPEQEKSAVNRYDADRIHHDRW